MPPPRRRALDVATPEPEPRRRAADAALVPPASTSMVPVPIAVLPFANLGGDAEQAWFSDGITEDIITELSRWRMLAVRSRAASFRHRGVTTDVAEVARELQVRYIVEGSVRHMGERVRITAQLIDASDGDHVWAEKYDRPVDALFAVQDELVRNIVSTLVGRVQASDFERAGRKPPASLAAYECVVRGNFMSWGDPVAVAEAEALFQQAITLDPGYGLAHALLAAMRNRAWYDTPIGDDDKLHQAHALALRAVELDPDESTCHSILALVCRLQGSFDLSLQHVRRSVELNPNNQWSMSDMGMMLTYAGEAAAALEWFAHARQTDPYFDPPWYWREYGMAYLLLHRYDDAASMFSHLSLKQYRISALRAANHALNGETAEAERHAAECLALRPGFSIRHMLAKQPFRLAADTDHLAAGMRLAGLPG